MVIKMNREAVLHIPLSQYAFAEDEHTLVIRLRVQKGDLKRCELYYGDRVCQQEPILTKKLEMKKAATDNLFDYYEVEIVDIYTRICYYFRLDDGQQQQYYYGREFCDTMNCNRTEYFQFPYLRREDIIDIPAWAEDVVMYHIFPDSFANGRELIEQNEKTLTLPSGHKSHCNIGGTLNGVAENISYLKDLGVNCIYLNPIFAANSYHKYDTIDYFEIDPCLGTMEDFKKLVNRCHENEIRVILDGVFNHCGPDFFAFRNVLEKGAESAYYDWFYYMPTPVEYKNPPDYEAFAYVKEMPKLNTGNPAVAEYFCKVGTYWITEADIDGWRLDVANEINHDFWRQFRKEVRAVKKDALLIGEIWEESLCWLSGDQFDSTMNYTFSYLCKDFFGTGELTVQEFDEQIQKMMMRYPRRVSLAQMNFLDSHDVPRFLSYCGGDRKKMELAFFYLFMGVGIPSVFYGDECYLEGITESEYRAPMPWQQEQNCVWAFRSWIAIRKKYDAIKRGSYQTVYTNNESCVYAFVRSVQGQAVLVILNNSEKEQRVNQSEIPAMRGERLLDIKDGGMIKEVIVLAGYTGKVFELV